MALTLEARVDALESKMSTMEGGFGGLVQTAADAAARVVAKEEVARMFTANYDSWAASFGDTLTNLRDSLSPRVDAQTKIDDTEKAVELMRQQMTTLEQDMAALEDGRTIEMIKDKIEEMEEGMAVRRMTARGKRRKG